VQFLTTNVLFFGGKILNLMLNEFEFSPSVGHQNFTQHAFHMQVDRRYNHYCDQMQMVVTFFDSVMGFGAATPYTALAQKAMSRHFRCLKDAIAAQLKQTCELLGEKDAGTGSGITRGETPRLRLIDQGLRQQRAFHHMGMMEQEAWRPQRGLPERSVNILRAWLFEHFLHPYVSQISLQLHSFLSFDT
jgi:Associated with HOX